MALSFFKKISRNHLLVLLLLCFSGNPLFVSNGNYQLKFIICLVTFLLICASRNQLNVVLKGLCILSPFVFVSMIHLLGFGNTITPVGKSFEKVYVDIMYWLAIFSLICFAIFKYTGILYGITLSSTEGVSLIFYTQLFSFGEVYDRNSGMFWEPGAYQGYLNLALLFLLKSDKKGRDKWMKVVVFSLALFTTTSTTGYLVYAVIIIMYVLRSKKLSQSNKFLLLIVITVFFTYEYYNLEFMKEKLEYETSLAEKDKSRVLDYMFFAELFKSNPLVGVGFADIPSGNGFLSFLLTWGVLGTIYYFTLLYNRIRRFWERQDTIVFILILILCLQGEGFLSYPLFLGLPCIILNKAGYSSLK